MSTKRRKAIEFEEGSGNVFADLGLKHADQLLARAQIGFHVFKILGDKKLKQREIASILGIAQPDVSHPDERAFQPLHDRQTARLPETA